MTINTKTASRLDKLAQDRGIRVSIQSSTKPRRRWYSVGNYHGGSWHQIIGFTDAGNVEQFIGKYGQ